MPLVMLVSIFVSSSRKLLSGTVEISTDSTTAQQFDFPSTSGNYKEIVGGETVVILGREC